jgi:hypothetical protein
MVEVSTMNAITRESSLYAIAPAAERFWEKVDVGREDDCWVWKARRDACGYGQILFQRRGLRAHRLSWELKNGAIPRGMLVCHRCDNPPCVNPAHLFLGTHTDNMRDMRRKGRGRTPALEWERHPACKLHRCHVEAIRRLDESGVFSRSEIAELFETTSGNIGLIVRGVTWKR